MNREKLNVSFILNGTKTHLEIPPQRTLLELLRRDLGLTSAKEGCGKGECGACTILLNGHPINSCLKMAATLKETDEVITLEGLTEDSLMKKIQSAFVTEGAIQCGFCTPGMVMSTYALLKRSPQPTEEEIKEALSGNLCRCTGYMKIISAVKEASK